MGDLLFILLILFAVLFLITKLLEGRAKPLSDVQQGSLSKWLIILVFISLISRLLYEMF
jgi:hypothetical protein